MKNKTKIILSSILSIILCASLIAGATFALFTNNSEVNIAVTSGKVNVQASISGFNTYSALVKAHPGTTEDIVTAEGEDDIVETGMQLGEFDADYYHDKQETGKFSVGGTAKVEENVLKLSKMVPGDKATATITLTNNSNVGIKYRLIIKCTSGLKLFSGLLFKVEGIGEESATTNVMSYASKWKTWTLPTTEEAKTQTLNVSVELPLDAGNEYQDLSTNVLFAIEAVQGNAATSDVEEIVYVPTNAVVTETAQKTVVAGQKTEITTPNTPVGSTGKETTVTFPANTSTLPAGKTSELTVETYAVAVSSVMFEVESNNQSACAGLELILKINGEQVTNFDGEYVTIVTYIEPGLSRVGVKYNGEGADPTDVHYDDETGELSFKTNHFSEYYVTADHTYESNNDGTHKVKVGTAVKYPAEACDTLGEGGKCSKCGYRIPDGVAIHNQDELTAFANGTLEGLAAAGYKGYLANDITVSDNITINFANITCTLDLNGKTLAGNVGNHSEKEPGTNDDGIQVGGLLTLWTDADLTINDISGNGKIINNHVDGESVDTTGPGYMKGGCVYLMKNSKMTLNGGTLQATAGKNNAAIGVRSGTPGEVLFINGGTIYGSGSGISNNGNNNDVNIVITGGVVKGGYTAIHHMCGGMRMSGGELIATDSGSSGVYTIYADKPTLEISGGKISGISYGIYVVSGTVLHVSGEAEISGGSCCFAFSGVPQSVELTGGIYKGNAMNSLIAKYSLMFEKYTKTTPEDYKIDSKEVTEDKLKAVYKEYYGTEYAGENIFSDFNSLMTAKLSELGVRYSSQSDSWYFTIYRSTDEAMQLIIPNTHHLVNTADKTWKVESAN